MAGNASTFFGLGGGGKPLVLVTRRVFKASGNIVIPAGGKYDIIAFGASGSGGSTIGSNGRATGGGGPAWARDWGEVATDTPLTVTLGAGGAAPAASGTPQSGNDGGTTTITGGAISITLTGGKAGSAANTIVNVNGGIGGVASGAKFNVPGSRGGNITTTGTGLKATGGGSINLFNTGSANATRGGDISGSTANAQATGGGGVGGRGGDNPAGGSFTTGGGAGGDATDTSSTGFGADILGSTAAANTQPSSNFVVDILATFPGIMPTSSGGTTTGSVLQGAGSAGSLGAAAGIPDFGGAGGIAYGSGNVTGTGAVLGGASGGVACAGTTANSGKGGDAMVIVSVYKEQT